MFTECDMLMPTQAGANILVAGSAVFGAASPKEVIASLRNTLLGALDKKGTA
jgi:pentose-5-phosphate-3-epimerase